MLGATLVEGGTWRERVVFREPLSDAGRMRLVLAQRLALLPAPAESLRLSVERFGPPHPAGAALFDDSSARRQVRLREAIRQVRAAAGPRGRAAHPGRRPRLAGARAPRRPDALRGLMARCSRSSPGSRRLGVPRPTVLAGPGGRPEAVDHQEVVAVRESWLIEDRWWTDRPLRRRYWEVVTLDGRDLVVFRELTGGGWYRHR